jgi:hypothetical protein
MAILVRLALVAAGTLVVRPGPATEADDQRDEASLAFADAAPPEWGFEGPYALAPMLAVGIGLRADDPPLFEPDTRVVPSIEAGLDLFLSRRTSLFLHYQRVALARERSGLLATGQVQLSRSVDSLWGGLRLDPLRSEAAAGYLRLGAGLAWQHLDAVGLAWAPVTPAVHTPISCGATALGFGIRAALGVDIPVGTALRFVGEAGADNYRLTSEVIGGCAPGAGTATLVGLRAGFAYGIPL